MPATIRGGKVIHRAALESLLRRGGAVVVDVSNAQRRPEALAPGAPWLPLPHRAIPGALWVPGAGAGMIDANVDVLFRETLAKAGGGNLTVPLVVYCHHRCWLSWNAARRAVGYGYRNVYWYADGIEGWLAGRQPTAQVEPTVAARPASGTTAVADLPKMLVLDLELTGDLGGPDFAAEHEARLRTESLRLRQDLERTGLYRIVDAGAAQPSIDRLKSQQAYLHDCNGCDLDVGRELGVDLVFTAWVDRVSNLILSLTYEIHDVKTGLIAARKSYDFRGDSDNAWNHAIDYMVRDVRATAGVPADGAAALPPAH